MSQPPDWSITILGMLAVAVTLAACAVGMQIFSWWALRLGWTRSASSSASPSAAAGGAGESGVEPAVRPGLPPAEPIEADVLAVIAAVLEVESKLYLGRPGSRLTIRRPAPQY